MNKRVAKPKRKLPLTKGVEATDADMDLWMRENHAEIAKKLRAAKAEMDAGKGTPLGSLEELLADVRRNTRRD
jgi:hypothetical protein